MGTLSPSLHTHVHPREPSESEFDGNFNRLVCILDHLSGEQKKLALIFVIHFACMENLYTESIVGIFQ